MPFPKNYIEVLKEYELLQDEHKEPYLYAFVGYALYVSQHLEKHLMNVIWGNKVINRTNETNEELNDYFDKYEFGKYTMGMLLKEVKKILNTSNEDIKELEKILIKRNYLVHNYFILNNHLVYAPDGYKIIIKDYMDYIMDVNRIEKKVIEYCYAYLNNLGISRESYDSMVNQEVEKWSKNYVAENKQITS